MEDLSKEELIQMLRESQEVIKELRKENALLRQKMDLLIRRVFGKSSEKISPDQLDLFLLGEEQSPGKGEASSLEEEAFSSEGKKSRGSKNKERWPKDLPVIEEVIEPKEVQDNPQDWRLIGAEVSEQLDYEPARFLLRRLIRNKYVKNNDRLSAPVIAPLPPSLQDRCLAAPGLLAAVVVQKYCDHLPLYRQEAIFKSRHGVYLPRQTLARWMGLVADWLKPIYEAIRTGVMAGGYVQVDETPIRYLSPGNGETKLGYLWTAHAPGSDVVYRWQTSRAAACLENIIPVDFKGILQCDAYAAYPSFARGRKITLAGCFAHARRKFFEAKESQPRRAALILRQIRHLYRIERTLRKLKAGPRLRDALRCAQSRPVFERLHKVLTLFKNSGRYLPQSAFGLAIDYALSNWQMLSLFLQDPRVEIDNNLVENAIRPTALGKKNWLFFGDANAGERSAILYTMIESCRRRSIDPYEYLRDVLTRLPSMTNWTVDQLTPQNWLKDRMPSPLKAAA
jgi:transposase